MYLTGDAEEDLCYVTLYIPDERFAKAALRGAIRELCFPHNWEEYNDLAPDEAADIFQTVFDSIVMCASEGGSMTPDYDSGWFSAAKYSYNFKAHGLGQTPLTFEVYYCPNAAGTGNIYKVTGDQDYPDEVFADETYIGCFTNPSVVVYHKMVQAGTGYFRYLAWVG